MRNIATLTASTAIAVATFFCTSCSGYESVNYYNAYGTRVGYSQTTTTPNGFQTDLNSERVNYYDQNGRQVGYSQQNNLPRGFAK